MLRMTEGLAVLKMPSRMIMSKHVTSGAGPSLAPGAKLNKFGRGLLDVYTQYQGPWHFDFRSDFKAFISNLSLACVTSIHNGP